MPVYRNAKSYAQSYSSNQLDDPAQQRAEDSINKNHSRLFHTVVKKLSKMWVKLGPGLQSSCDTVLVQEYKGAITVYATTEKALSTLFGDCAFWSRVGQRDINVLYPFDVLSPDQVRKLGRKDLLTDVPMHTRTSTPCNGSISSVSGDASLTTATWRPWTASAVPVGMSAAASSPSTRYNTASPSRHLRQFSKASNASLDPKASTESKDEHLRDEQDLLQLIDQCRDGVSVERGHVVDGRHSAATGVVCRTDDVWYGSSLTAANA
ncbi:hypothetical protein LTR95_018085 [Oleoguttula sp. CCFEE 5521]